jgi:glucan 1,3-beta-glucosidase
MDFRVLARAFVALASAFYLFSSIAALTFGFPYGSQKVCGVNLGGCVVICARHMWI